MKRKEHSMKSSFTVLELPTLSLAWLKIFVKVLYLSDSRVNRLHCAG